MSKQRRVWLFLICLLVLLPLGLKMISRADPAVKSGVVYGHAGDQDLQLDVFGATPGKKSPAIVFLHGGGWVSGSRNDMTVPASLFAQQGYVCFTVSYRLVKGDQNRYPAQIDDVQRAVRWIRAHATEYGVNPDKIGALGASAGGHLVALLGTTDTRDNSDPALAMYSSRVQCVVDLYGPTNFNSLPITRVLNDTQRKAAVQLMEGFLGPLPQNTKNYSEASPITHINSKTAPFLIFHGGKDALVPVEQSEEMDAALHKAGIESKLIVFPEAGHAYSDPESLKKTVEASTEFFARHLKN